MQEYRRAQALFPVHLEILMQSSRAGLARVIRPALWLAAFLPVAPALATSCDAPAWPVVQQYIAAWNEHDVLAAGTTLDAQVSYFSTSAATTRQGSQVVLDVVKGLTGLIPDLRWRVLGTPVQACEQLAFEWEFSGTAQFPAQDGKPAASRPVSLRGASFVRVEHGRIVQLADYYNGLTMREQLAH
ncbi:ester cyclase [Kerstersia gyiorum]|nr:hypothetical protein CBF45_12905 [Bordetella sp. J329]KAB0542704.1 ester cyclase [Kerstersia gyiorum]